jgi:predicted Zn-dependent protease
MFEKALGEDSELDRQELEKIEVSVKEEQTLGSRILTAGLQSLKESGITVESKGRDVEYVESLVETLKPFMKNKDRYEKIRVMIAQSPRVDARSCPGGTLIFYEGLLDKAGSEAALVGIVGHELSHLDRGHQLLPIRRAKMMEKSFSNPQVLAHSGEFGMWPKLWARPFRPEDERDADRDGAAWAYAAGYDPREMAHLFQKAASKNTNAPWMQFFQSHPSDLDRSQAILKQFAQMQKESPSEKPLEIARENLKKRFSLRQAANIKQ